MHTTHLIRPVLSSTLLHSASHQTLDTRWPDIYTASQANAIFVDPDWKDLETTIMWLRDNPSVAEGIAQRQSVQFVESGILGEAADTCYWRALVRGWSTAAILDEKWKETLEEVRWETFSLMLKR